MSKRVLLIGLLTMSILSVFTQSFEFGAITGVEWKYSFKSKIKLTIEEELRFNQDVTHFDRSKTSVGLSYKPFGKNLKIGGSFDYILKNKIDFFENRYRGALNISYSKKMGQFSAGIKSSVQATFFDSNLGVYKRNPLLYWRNKIQIEYSVFHKPIKIGLSSELFYRLNHQEYQIIDEVRSEVYLYYRFSQSNSITLFMRSINEIQVKKPENIIYFGITYHLKN
jgi:hypothetical protein